MVEFDHIRPNQIVIMATIQAKLNVSASLASWLAVWVTAILTALLRLADVSLWVCLRLLCVVLCVFVLRLDTV